MNTPTEIVLDNNDPADTADPIPRNRYGAPRAPHPTTGKTITWQRPSGLAKKFLSDKYHLDMWVQRTIAKGAGLAPDLGALAAHLDLAEDKTQLDDLAAQMGRAGGRDAKANVGTAIHAVMERILNGETPDYSPDLRPTVEAIQDIIDRYDIQAPFVEPFIMTPDVVIGAGSADGLVTTNVTDPTRLTVFDLKTGQRDPRQFTTLTEWAVQLAVYAHATHRWEGVGHQPVELPPINTDLALVLWAPSGSDHAELIGIDIAAGWELVQLCMDVKAARSRTHPANMAVELPKYRPPATPDGADTPPHVQLMTTLAGLRVRLRAMTRRGVVTRDDIVAHWPVDTPLLRGAEHNADHDQWSVAHIAAYVARVETRFGMDPADPTMAASARAAIGELPADLAADLLATIHAAGINPDDLRTRDIAEIGALLTAHDTVVAERENHVAMWLSSAPAIARGALDLLAERLGLPDGTPSDVVRPLTARDATMFEALCTFYAARPDGSTVDGRAADIVAAYGGRAAAVTAAKMLAAEYGFERPRSTEAVAGDAALTALVLHHKQT